MTIGSTTTRILRLPDVRNRTGLSRSTIYALVKNECFPKYISLGIRSVGWVETEVEAWIEERINMSRAVQMKSAGKADDNFASDGFVNTIESGKTIP